MAEGPKQDNPPNLNAVNAATLSSPYQTIHWNQQASGNEGDDFRQDFSKNENTERGNWPGRLDFLLASLGYVVGLRNIWRFPYLCSQHGGAAFLITYVIMMMFMATPLIFLEFSLGQFTSSGPLTCWEMARFFKGIGVAMVIISGLVGIYYNVIIAWFIFYLCASFTSDLPWTSCKDKWSSDFCKDNIILFDDPQEGFRNCTNNYGPNAIAEDDGVCYNQTAWYIDKFGEEKNYTVIGIWNLDKVDYYKMPRRASEDYLYGYVLGSYYSRGIENLGTPRWDLTLCLLTAWIIVCLTLILGVRSYGKVVYITVLFPYVALIILLIRGVTLDGYTDGIKAYMTETNLEILHIKLSKVQVWKDAAVQVFFSLSVSLGGLITLASYNRFHNNCLRDSLILPIGNFLTSFFAGFVIFSFLGVLAHQEKLYISEVNEPGVSLVFIWMLDVFARLSVSHLWIIIFLLMMITVGLNTQFGLVETVITSLVDQFPRLRKKRPLFVVAICVTGFLLGLTMTTNGGIYMLQVMDHYSAVWNVLLIALFECICIAYIYGLCCCCRFRNDIRCMIGTNFCFFIPIDCCYWWWAVMWLVFTPTFILFMLIVSLKDYSEVTIGWDYEFPRWAVVMGWLITMFSVVGLVATIIVLFIIQIIRRENILNLFRPSHYWGPALPEHRRLMSGYLSLDDFEVDPWRNEQPVEMTNVDVFHGQANIGLANGEQASLRHANEVQANLGYANEGQANLGYANEGQANLGHTSE